MVNLVGRCFDNASVDVVCLCSSNGCAKVGKIQFGSGIRLMLRRLRATRECWPEAIVDIVEDGFDKVSIHLTL